MNIQEDEWIAYGAYAGPFLRFEGDYIVFLDSDNGQELTKHQASVTTVPSQKAIWAKAQAIRKANPRPPVQEEHYALPGVHTYSDDRHRRVKDATN